MSPAEIQAFIRANLPIADLVGLPGIRLHRAAPSSGLRRLAEADPDFGSPYWAHPWGGGLALARYLQEHPEAVAGRRVLDLGCGCGLVAIAAARAGAREITAVDISPYAVAATALNAELNSAKVTVVLGAIPAGGAPATDVVLIGDLFYERALARRVLAFARGCRASGVEVLIGDPWRATLPRKRLRLLAEYQVGDFGDHAAAATPAGVFVLDR